MASQALYRKWRSQTFDEMVGQEALKQTLKNALSSGKLAHAYLFTGPRGTGKTTTARLLAKTINCSNPQDGEPCNQCEQCHEITLGNSFNVIEIDAASNRGIDSIRELREKVRMPPATGKYKVYILDEAHMLTVEAFNALLKTLEEPPEHAIFVMATTDVHKMLPTVLSRCQRFDFKRFTTRQIIEHLKHISLLEEVELGPGAAELIARAAAGGMRDALSLLDQAIAYCGPHISLSQVQAMLGVADPRMVQKLVQTVAVLESAAGLHLIHELSNAGADLRQVNSQVGEYWRSMMLSREGANVGEIMDCTEDEVREINQTARQFTPAELTECTRVFALNDVMQRGTPQLGLELAFLACIEVHRRAQSGVSLHLEEPAVSHQSTPARPMQPDPRPVRPAMPQPDNVGSSSIQQPAQRLAEPKYSPPVVPASPPPPQRIVAQAQPPVEAVEQVVEQSSGPALTVQDVQARWDAVIQRVKSRKDGAKIAASLKGHEVIKVEGANPPVVVLRARFDYHHKLIQQKEEYVETVIWSFRVALDRKDCEVKLLPPGSHPSKTNGSQSTPTAPLVLPRRESQASTAQQRPAAPPQEVVRQQEPEYPPELDDIPPPGDEDAPENVQFSSTLARITPVRENITEPTPPLQSLEVSETRRESAMKAATNDPVVMKAVELFKAKITEVKVR
jgi:DNA polymerase-3 subunit gamma/tau